jgi:cysteine desulfurase
MLYLDHNATTPILSQVQEAMIPILSQPLNPSSIHSCGRIAKAIIEEARGSIARMMGLDLRKNGYGLIFTSSGTEANNLMMKGYCHSSLRGDDRILVSSIEHHSILRHSEYNSNIDILEVDSNGIVKIDLLEEWLARNNGGLVSIMLANNETGVIQPIKQISSLVHKYNGLLHSDCIQVIGKIALDLIDCDIDFVTISGHKFGGALGAGALIYRNKYSIAPQIIGGGQERGTRAGTENVAAIASMGAAAEYHLSWNGRSCVSNLRDLFESRIASLCQDVQIFGKDVPRLPNTSMLTMPGVPASKQLIAFDMAGIALSSGSACSSGKVKASHVLGAMGVDPEIADWAIRVSFGSGNTESDVDRLVDTWITIWKNNDKK